MPFNNENADTALNWVNHFTQFGNIPYWIKFVCCFFLETFKIFKIPTFKVHVLLLPDFFINTDSLILIKLLNLIDLNLLFSDIVPPFFKTMPACVMVRYFFFLSLETSSKYVEGFLGYTYCAKIQCYCITIKSSIQSKRLP